MNQDLFSHHPAYPHAPAAQARDTSVAAARQIKRRAGTIRERVLDAIAERPMASFELARVLGVSFRSTQPRTSELAATGAIEDCGLRRIDPETDKAVVVWRLTTAASQNIKKLTTRKLLEGYVRSAEMHERHDEQKQHA